MYYLNCFFTYSILGYFLETIMSLILKYDFESGILYGWWTPVYGFGAVIIILVSKYLFKHLHMNRFLETLIMFFVCALILSVTELVGGLLIERVFGVVFWSYENQRFNLGPYISLEMAFVWGVSSVLFVYLIHPLLNKIIKKIPVWLTLILTFLFVIDFTLTFITGFNN